MVLILGTQRRVKRTEEIQGHNVLGRDVDLQVFITPIPMILASYLDPLRHCLGYHLQESYNVPQGTPWRLLGVTVGSGIKAT